MADTSRETSHDPSRSEKLYEALIEGAFDMVQSCRPDGSFEFVNRAWREKLGYSAEDVRNMIIWDIVHEDSRAHCEELFMAALGGQSVDGVRATFVSKDGRAVPVEGNASCRFDAQGNVVATHSFFRDISERLQAEELAQRNAELERQAALRSIEKMAALGKLSAGLAHELNNPAAAVRRAAEQATEQWREFVALTSRLQRAGLTDDQWQRLQKAAEARRSSAVRELSALARADREEEAANLLSERGLLDPWSVAGELVAAGFDQTSLDELTAGMPAEALEDGIRWLACLLAMAELLETMAVSSRSISELVGAVKEYSYMDRAPEQEVDVHDGLETTLRILQHKLKNGITVERNYDRTLPRITVPAGELNQVWTNIIDNAIDASPEGGVVTVSTFRDGRSLVVEIGDQGSGIPEEIQSRIFDPFFTTKAIGRGSGIGLDVALRIVTDLCGGGISFESTPGDTRFRVSLPLGRAGTEEA